MYNPYCCWSRFSEGCVCVGGVVLCPEMEVCSLDVELTLAMTTTWIGGIYTGQKRRRWTNLLSEVKLRHHDSTELQTLLRS